MLRVITLLILSFLVNLCYSDKKLDSYMVKKDYEKALKYVETNLKNVQDEEVIYNIGYANEQLGNNEKAIASYLSLNRLKPTNCLVLSSIIRIYYKMKLYERAYSYSINLIQIDSLTEEYKQQYADVCYKLNKIDEAQKIYETLNSKQAKIVLSDIYYNKKMYNKAIPLLQIVLSKEKNDSTALKLSNCYSFVDKLDSSIIYLKTIKSLTNNEILKLARFYCQLEQYDLALEEYKKLSTQIFENIDFYNQAKCYEKNGDIAKTLVFYETALKKNSDIKQSLDIKLKIVRIHINSKNFSNAFKYIRDLEQQKGIDFDEIMTLYFNGINNYERTIYFANKVLKTDSTNISLIFTLINAYEKQGMITKANQLINTLQKDSQNILKLAEYYYENSNYSKAIDFFEKMYIVSGDSKILEKIAICSNNLKDYDKAKDASETLLRKKIESIECRKILYQIALSKKKYLDAAFHLEVLLKKDSSLIYYKDLSECYKNLNNEKLFDIDKKIIRLDKNNIESRERLISIFVKNNKQEALRLYFELENLRKFSETDYFNIIYLLDKDEQISILYLKKIIALNSANVEAHKQLGDIFYNQKKYDEAYTEYNYVMLLDDSRVDYLKNFCYIVIIKKNIQEIIKIGNKAFNSNQTDSYILTNLAESYYNLSDFAKTLIIYSRLPQNKIDTSILLKMAICQEKTNDISAAIVSYEQYVSLCQTAKNEYLTLAELYYKNSKVEQAISTYKIYLRKYKDEKLSNKVAQYEYQQEKYSEATKYFSESNISRDLEQMFMFGYSMYMTKQYDDAISILSTCEKLNFSKISEVYSLIAISYEKLNNLEKAIQYYKSYTQLNSKDSTLCFHTAELQEKLNVNLSKGIYESNTKKFINDSRNFLHLAEIYYNLNDFKRSKIAFERVKKLQDSASVDFLLKLASCYKETNDKDNEIKIYKEVLSKDKQNFTANKFLGIYYYEADSLNVGLTYLEFAKTCNYNDPDILYTLGRIYLKDELTNEGIMFVQSAKKQKPKDTKIRLFIIETYKKYGKLKDASLEIEELLKIDRSFKNLAIYAKTLYELKNYQNAEAIYVEMRKQEPSNIDLLMFLGQIKLDQLQLDDALEYYKMVTYIDSKYAPAICKRADIYLLKKDIDLAKEFYLKAIKANSKYAMSYYGISMIYKNSGDTKQYIENISKAITLDSTNSIIIQEIKRSKEKENTILN